MNKEQKELVTQNHNLIYSFMKKNGLSLNSVEDWYGTCAIGLCKAAINYKEDFDLAFSTLAYVCMSNEVKHVLRKKNIETVYINTNTFPSHDSFKEFELCEIIKTTLLKTNAKHRDVISDCIKTDKTRKEIGTEYNISAQSVGRIYNKFLNDIITCLERG